MAKSDEFFQALAARYSLYCWECADMTSHVAIGDVFEDVKGRPVVKARCERCCIKENWARSLRGAIAIG